ncbi:MAG: hypothetical protein INR70_42850 [Parafilimonas terrae]|nr:hypothetical protein [Parafilimonas terrae]
MANRLRLSRIEANKKKSVSFVRGSTRTVPLSERQEDTLHLLMQRIEQGQELPTYCYRVNRDTTPDELLEREGIMHLHLSPDERNATLFLIQYENHVVFLGVNGHEAFRDDPPGSYLYQLHANAIAEEETRIDAEEAEATATKAAGVRAGLLPRSHPKAASAVVPPPKPKPGRSPRRPGPSDG